MSRENNVAEFRCDCGAHYLTIEEFVPGYVWCGFYVRRGGAGYTLRSRIKDAFSILRGRDFLVDDYVFDSETTKRLARELARRIQHDNEI